MTNNTNTTATITLYSDPNVAGLAYSADGISGPAGPDRSDIVSRVDLRDAIADDAADAIAALRAAGLVVDVDRSRRGSDGMEADVTVTSWVAAARILERL